MAERGDGPAGELEGAAARLEWDQMPRRALRSEASGLRSRDFCTATRYKSNGIVQSVEKVISDFFDRLADRM